MLYAAHLNHFFQAVVFEAGEEVPDADCTAGLGDRPGVVAADLPSRQRRRAHCRRTRKRGVRQEQGLGRDFDRLLYGVLGRMRDVADKPEPVAGADHLGPVRGQPLIRDEDRARRFFARRSRRSSSAFFAATWRSYPKRQSATPADATCSWHSSSNSYIS